MSPLTGKNIIITGATSGLGVDIASLLSSEGADVFIGGRRADRGAAVAKETNTTFHVVDVADEESNKAFFAAAEKHFGRVEKADFVLLNAGVEGNKEIHITDLSVDNIDYIYSVNVRGVLLGMKYGTPLLRSGGSILVTSSVTSILPAAIAPIYVSSKAAVDSLVRSFAAQIAESDDERIKSLSVLSINPTLYETAMADRLTGDNKDVLDGFSKAFNPVQRVGKSSELAVIVRDYVQGDLPYKSGDTFCVDGDTHFPLSEYFDRMKAATAKA